MDYTEWPVIDSLDFTHVEFDVTRWEDESYTLMINYYSEIAEKEGDKNSGMTFCLQLGADSLEEMHLRISALVALGLFDNLEISGLGTIWDSEGDQIGEVQWNEFVLDIDEDEDEDPESAESQDDVVEDPLHHRAPKTVQ